MTGLRLDLTVKVDDVTSYAEAASTLRAAQRSITGAVRLVVLHLDAREGHGPTPGPLTADDAAFDWSSDPAHISVAVISGCLQGWGVRLALGCDLRILAADAQLSLAADAGLLPDLGAIVATLGYAKALELTLTGRPVTAAEALAAGLVERVAEPDRLEDEVERLSSALLAPDRDVAREVKALLLRAENRPREHEWGAQREARLRLLE